MGRKSTSLRGTKRMKKLRRTKRGGVGSKTTKRRINISGSHLAEDAEVDTVRPRAASASHYGFSHEQFREIGQAKNSADVRKIQEAKRMRQLEKDYIHELTAASRQWMKKHGL